MRKGIFDTISSRCDIIKGWLLESNKDEDLGVEWNEFKSSARDFVHHSMSCKRCNPESKPLPALLEEDDRSCMAGEELFTMVLITRNRYYFSDSGKSSSNHEDFLPSYHLLDQNIFNTDIDWNFKIEAISNIKPLGSVTWDKFKEKKKWESKPIITSSNREEVD